jgi:alpha-ketoglutarate-dependent taurine dioxygenase
VIGSELQAKKDIAMPITITQLHPLFCAEIAGVDTGAPMGDKTFTEIRAALDEYSVLVFHDQSLDDALLHRSPAWAASGRVTPGRVPSTLQEHPSCRSKRMPLGAITSPSRSTG